MVPAVVVGREEDAEAGCGSSCDRRSPACQTAVPRPGQVDRPRLPAGKVGRLELRGRRRPSRARPAHGCAPARPAPRRAPGRSSSRSMAAARPAASRSGTSRPLSPSVTTAPMPPAGVVDERRPRGQRLEHHVGQAVDVAGVVAHRRHDRDVGGGEGSATASWPRMPGKRTRSATPAVQARARSSASRSPPPATTTCSAGVPCDQRRHRVDQVLEPLLPHEAAGGEDDRRVRGDAEAGPARGSRRPAPGPKRLASTP